MKALRSLSLALLLLPACEAADFTASNSVANFNRNTRLELCDAAGIERVPLTAEEKKQREAGGFTYKAKVQVPANCIAALQASLDAQSTSELPKCSLASPCSTMIGGDVLTIEPTAPGQFLFTLDG